MYHCPLAVAEDMQRKETSQNLTTLKTKWKKKDLNRDFRGCCKRINANVESGREGKDIIIN